MTQIESTSGQTELQEEFQELYTRAMQEPGVSDLLQLHRAIDEVVDDLNRNLAAVTPATKVFSCTDTI